MCGKYKGWGKLADFSNTELYPIGCDYLVVAIILKRPNHSSFCIYPISTKFPYTLLAKNRLVATENLKKGSVGSEGKTIAKSFLEIP